MLFFPTRSRGRNSRLRVGPRSPSDVDWLWSNLKCFGKCPRPHFYELHTAMAVEVPLLHTAILPCRAAYQAAYNVACGEVRPCGKPMDQCTPWRSREQDRVRETLEGGRRDSSASAVMTSTQPWLGFCDAYRCTLSVCNDLPGCHCAGQAQSEMPCSCHLPRSPLRCRRHTVSAFEVGAQRGRACCPGSHGKQGWDSN